MPDQTHTNGHAYTKISMRCPGLQTSAPVLIAPPPRPAPVAPPPASTAPAPPQPELFDRQKAAAGDREDLT